MSNPINLNGNTPLLHFFFPRQSWCQRGMLAHHVGSLALEILKPATNIICDRLHILVPGTRIFSHLPSSAWSMIGGVLFCTMALGHVALKPPPPFTAQLSQELENLETNIHLPDHFSKI